MATRLKFDRTFLLARRESCGPELDGEYIVGVKTTGVYCLPSCRPPRLAKAENIEFYASPDDARADGLRPCKLCRPDDFYLGHHAGEALVEALVGRISRHPQQYSTARAMVCDSGVGTSKLHELFRVHYHTTPSELLTRKRVALARRLLLERCLPVPDVAFEVGFESLSAFNANFRKYSASTPAAYRKVVDIGNLGGVAWNTPMAMNERGDIVGFSNHDPEDEGAFNPRAFLWTARGGIVDLGTLGGHTTSQALGINNRGQIVGLSCGEDGCSAVLWEKNGTGMIDLNSLPNAGASGHLYTANDINNRGQITGQVIAEGTGEARTFLATPRPGR